MFCDWKPASHLLVHHILNLNWVLCEEKLQVRSLCELLWSQCSPEKEAVHDCHLWEVKAFCLLLVYYQWTDDTWCLCSCLFFFHAGVPEDIYGSSVITFQTFISVVVYGTPVYLLCLLIVLFCPWTGCSWLLFLVMCQLSCMLLADWS